MPTSRLESLPQELRERIYFYLGFPIAGKCIHNCAHQTCKPDIDDSIPRHPRAKPHYVDIWDEWVRCGGAGLKMLDVRSVDVRSGRVEGVDVLLFPAVCMGWFLRFGLWGEADGVLQVSHTFKVGNKGLLLASRFLYHDLLVCMERSVRAGL
jgi:hypothetical protein